jgi:DNA polymerase
LRAQIKLMKPRLMLILGREASRALLPPQRIRIGRGRWVDYRTIDGTLPSLMTFHPNFLVLNPDHKRHAFEDLKMFKARMDKELS